MTEPAPNQISCLEPTVAHPPVMSNINIDDKDIPVSSLLDSSVSNSDSDSQNEDISISRSTKSRKQPSVKNSHSLTNVALLIKIGMNAFAQAQQELNTFCKFNKIPPPVPTDWGMHPPEAGTHYRKPHGYQRLPDAEVGERPAPQDG